MPRPGLGEALLTEDRGKKSLLGLAGAATDLGEEQVDTERSVLIVEVALELVNLIAKHLGGVADTTDDTETTGVGDGGSQLGSSGDVHAGQQDGVLDLEKIRDGRANLLCTGKGKRVSVAVLSGSPAMPRLLGVRATTDTRQSREQGGNLRGEAIVNGCVMWFGLGEKGKKKPKRKMKR